MGRIFVCGDTHHDHDIAKIQPQNFTIQKDLTKDDVLIVAGDWGGIWYHDYRNGNLLDWWESRNFTTLVVDGNHENFNAIKELKIVERFGGKVRRVSESVFIAERGEIYTINGKKILTLGGAESIDKDYRVEGYSWWKDEKITEIDISCAFYNLEKYDFSIDYIISHTGGSEICHHLGFTPTTSDYFLDKILAASIYKKHYLGHYHLDKLIDKSRILYDDVIEI
ncbi:MAG: metallophosphoesterase [Methanobrevibacter smithii]